MQPVGLANTRILDHCSGFSLQYKILLAVRILDQAERMTTHKKINHTKENKERKRKRKRKKNHLDFTYTKLINPERCLWYLVSLTLF